MSEPVEIIVTYTAEDLAITTRHLARRRSGIFKDFVPLVLFLLLAFLINFFLSPEKNLQGLFQPRSIFVFLLLTSFSVLLFLARRRKYGFFAKRHFQKRIDGSPALGGEKTIKFSDAGVRFTEKLSTTEINWEAYTQIRETDDYFYFFISNQTAQIFPKRAFSDHGLEMLRLLLRSYLPPDRNLELFA